jgi:hypothetical protein
LTEIIGQARAMDTVHFGTGISLSRTNLGCSNCLTGAAKNCAISMPRSKTWSSMSMRSASRKNLSAFLVFEQSYGMIDGDSASMVELCALLSNLSDASIRPSRGSAN